MLIQYYEQRGVAFASGESATSFEGDGCLTGVGFKSGRQLPADLVVAGVGVKPATAILEGLVSLSDGVMVNEYLETSVPGIYAAGATCSSASSGGSSTGTTRLNRASTSRG